MPMPATRLLLLIATVVIATGIAVAAVLALSARGGDEVSLEGITISELDLGGAKLLVPTGDPVLSAEQAEFIVLSKRLPRFGSDSDPIDVRETRLVRFVNETSAPPIDALAWAVNLDPETVPAVTPSGDIGPLCCPPIGGSPTPTPQPTPLNCGLRTVYDVVFIDARTGEWLHEAKSTELIVPEPGETCPPSSPTIAPTEMPTQS